MEILIKVNNFVEWEESYYLGAVKSMAITSNDKYIISGSNDKSIKVFDLKAKKEVHHFENCHEGRFVEWEESYCLDAVHSLVVTSDNKYIISGSWDKSIRVFDLQTFQDVYHFKNAHFGK